MPTIRTYDSVAAGTQVENAVAGNQFEFLGAPSRVQIYAEQDSGGTPGVGEVEVFFGQELQYRQARINLGTAGPKAPDDMIVDDYGDRGDRIVVRLIETGGTNAAVIRTQVKITPIAGL